VARGLFRSLPALTTAKEKGDLRTQRRLLSAEPAC
jgi:hypothetical protein